MEMRIHLDGKAEAARWFKLKPRQIDRASRLSINQVTNELHKQLGGSLPRDAGTSVVGYRKVRAKKSLAKARSLAKRGVTWMGTMKIPAKYGGRMKQVHGGVKVGRHFFENAFIATMKNDYQGVFKRIQGTDKIEQAMIDMPNADAQAATAASWAEARYKNVLRKRLHIELNKKY